MLSHRLGQGLAWVLHACIFTVMAQSCFFVDGWAGRACKASAHTERARWTHVLQALRFAWCAFVDGGFVSLWGGFDLWNCHLIAQTLSSSEN